MRSKIVTLTLALVLGAATVHADGLKIPEYRTVTLDNGLTILLLEQPTVPLVSLELWADAGAWLDPTGKEGLAYLTSEALRKGAGDRNAQEFAEATDFLGAQFGTSTNTDRLRVTMNLRSGDLDAGLALFADASLRPQFDAAEIQKLAEQLGESVIQAKDNPRNVLGDYNAAFLYGAHPYANPVNGTETSLPTITADDVRGFYRDFVGADRAILAVAGDIQPDALEAKLREVFGAMPKAQAPLPALPDPKPSDSQRVLLVNKNDTPQTWFLIGGLGPAFDHDDYAAAEIVRTVFGGRFTSWLNTKLRVETGLTYGARYNFSPRRVAGPAGISTFTATETTKDAFDLALEQLERLHAEGIGAEDLASAKAYFKGQTPYDFETASNMANAIAELQFYGVDRSRLDTLFEQVDAVDEAACKAAIAKYFGKENLVITAIGVADEVRDILSAYGKLTERENSDPGFSAPVGAP